ncbi:hypothetical protein BASA61_002244 [Batrachochytrium salamandrivorans]|nr:hypothetical protein BASA61_002244 [Batrachochytrium salamandrivorans]
MGSSTVDIPPPDPVVVPSDLSAPPVDAPVDAPVDVPLDKTEAIPVASDAPAETSTKKQPLSTIRRNWLCCTWCLTWWIPSFLLRMCGKMSQPAVQLAWREKVALNIIILFMCCFLLFYIIGLGLIICPKTSALSQGEIEGRKDIHKPIVSLYGNYYRIPDIIKSHVSDGAYLNEEAMKSTTLGRDVSAMFFKIDQWNKLCPGIPHPTPGWDNIARDVPKEASTVWLFHRGKDKIGRPIDYIELIRYMKKGAIARNKDYVQARLADDPVNNYILVAYGKIFDVTTYMSRLNGANFLGNNIKDIIRTLGQTGKDSTQYLERIKTAEGVEQWRRYMICLDNMFYVGVVDHRSDPECIFSKYILLISSILLVTIIGFKFIAAIQITPKGNPEMRDRYVVCCIPCYSEGADSLRCTIDSVATSIFEDSGLLLFIIADGMVMGEGNSLTTPQIVLQIIGVDNVDFSDMSECFPFVSLGEGQSQWNQARIFSGLYTKQGRQVPFIVIAKIGSPNEIRNMGNRVHTKQVMSPLEIELLRHFNEVICVHPARYEFILWVDADTEIYPDAINHYVSAMASDSAISGICGETILRNEGDSWVTMIQVYEYFISHHLAKAFESLFGSVTCLPGCFCMYRIFSSLTFEPVLVAPNVIADYGENNVNTLHLKNLLTLGEDRYLTTLMLKHFPDTKIKFTPDARAKTNAPKTWSVLISQRRRWINSTVHNLLELLTLHNLCGFCIFSMRFVVFLDLFATVVAPAGVIYVVYLIVSLTTDEDAQVPMISIFMIAAIYGLQVAIFVLKREWQHIGWMLVYILAIPLFSFMIPLYAFWRFDDFSWGDTRMVVNRDSDKSTSDQNHENYDFSKIPMKYAPELNPKPPKCDSVKSCDQIEKVTFTDKFGDDDDDDDDKPVLSTKPSQGHDTIEIQTLQNARVLVPSDADLTIRIRQILSTADMSWMTRRRLRLQLENEYGISLADRSALIRECIDTMGSI